MPREALTLQIGQCGNMVGFEFWKTLCAEHNIDERGNLRSLPQSLDDRDCKEVFFYESDAGRWVPRSVLVDLEPRVLRSIRDSHAGLFNSENFCESKVGGGAGNNWASGYEQASGELENSVMEAVDREAEACESLEAIILTHAVSGGTGSGVGSYLMETLAERYNKKLRVSFSVFPNLESEDVVVAPYNSVLTLARLAREMDAVVVLDNKALERIATEKLRMSEAKMSDINYFVSQIMSAATSLVRFPTSMWSSLSSLFHQLVPFPELHFLIAGFTPLLAGPGSSGYGGPKPSSEVMAKTSVGDVMRRLLQPGNQMISTKFLGAKTGNGDPHSFLSLAALVQGSGIDSSQMDHGLQRMKELEQVRWPPWDFFAPIVAKCRRSPFLSNPHKVSGLLLANHTGISELFAQTGKKFDSMREKKGFIAEFRKFQRFRDSDEEFQDSREAVRKLCSNYHQAAGPNFLSLPH